MALSTTDKDRLLAAMAAAAYRVSQERGLGLCLRPQIAMTHDHADRLHVELSFQKEQPAPDPEKQP